MKRKKHGLTKHPLFWVWHALLQRCQNKNSVQYKNYGGRGITVCEEWKDDVQSFYNWSIDSGYKQGLTLDRKDNDKGYCPSNCRWVDRSTSSMNTRSIKINNTSGYRGVILRKDKRFKKYHARIDCFGKTYGLGFYNTAQEAAKAYNDFVIKNKTEHPLNIIIN